MAISELDTLKIGGFFYSDIPANFQKSVVTNDLSASYDLRAIRESLIGIVSTVKGDRPFQPNFGCDINNQLFENISPSSAFSIKYNIETAIKQYEPRVRVTYIDVRPLYDQNSYEITVQYHLITDIDNLYSFKHPLIRRSVTGY